MAKSRLATLMAFDRQIFAEETGRAAPSTAPKKSSKGSKGEQLKLFSSAHTYIIGVDEVGRGCLAGPVVAGAVMLPVLEVRSALATKLSRLDDSKLIPAPVREELRAVICASSYYSVAEASAAEIDEINILNASLLAMKRAVYDLLTRLPMAGHEVLVLVDGNRNIKEFDLQQKTVIQGDSHSASIAAASVVAKVHRDKLMCDLSHHFPQYLWHKNKGYGSKAHRQAIGAHGSTIWHRQSFRLLAVGTEAEYDDQLADEIDSETDSALRGHLRSGRYR
jgi:ribonuclease HII